MNFLLTVHDFRDVNGYTLAPRHLALGLKSKGHKVKFLCLYKPLDYYDNENEGDFIVAKPQNIISNKQLNEFSPDVVITNGNSIVDIKALDYAKRKHKFVISFIHSRYEKIISQHYLPLGAYWPENIVTSLAEVFLQQFSHADVIIALSPEMETYLEKYFPKEKIRIVGNGIDLEQFRFSKRSVDDAGIINLLYVANLEKRKNQTFLIKMMEYLPDNYILHLVGGKSEPDYSLKFKKALNKYLLKHNNIIYYGKISHKKIGEIYKIAHIFVDSSLMEAQSIVLLEAMASGIPVVRLNSEDTNGVTIHKVTAIHVQEPAKPEEFAAKIRDLVKDKAMYSRICRNQHKIRNEFSREFNTAKLVKIIESSVAHVDQQ